MTIKISAKYSSSGQVEYILPWKSTFPLIA